MVKLSEENTKMDIVLNGTLFSLSEIERDDQKARLQVSQRLGHFSEGWDVHRRDLIISVNANKKQVRAALSDYLQAA